MTYIDDLQIVKYNLMLHSILLIISNITYHLWNNEKLFDNTWKSLVIATIIAYLIHGLLINKIVSKINNFLKITDYRFSKSISDIFQYVSVYNLQKIISLYIQGKELIFDEIWFTLYVFTIFGYIIFNLINPFILNPLYEDLFKTSLGFITANYYVQNYFPNHTPRSFTILFGVLFGLIFFHSFINMSI